MSIFGQQWDDMIKECITVIPRYRHGVSLMHTGKDPILSVVTFTFSSAIYGMSLQVSWKSKPESVLILAKSVCFIWFMVYKHVFTVM